MFHQLILLLLVYTATLVLAGASKRLHIENLVVFGDSYSDNGTGIWVLSNGTAPSDPAYYNHEYSNGLVWVQDLAASFGWSLDDYAMAGATSNNSLALGVVPGTNTVIPSTLDQLNEYLKSRPTQSKLSTTLFAIQIGGNDITVNTRAKASDTLVAVKTMITTLRSKGASHFLLGIPPDMSTIPYDNFLPANATAIRHAYSASYEKQVLALAHVSPEFTVTVVDGYALFKKILAHPQAYGYDPRTIHTSCLVGAFGEAPRSLCSDPDRFVFWDAAHPTRKTHKYVSELAQHQLLAAYQ